MNQTKALRKIAKLKKRIKCIQGGQGAGKTIAILILLINHAYSNKNKEIIIGSEELTKMRLTVIKDFVKIMQAFGIYDPSNFIAGTLYRFPNGSFIKFIGMDKEDVGKGLRCDVFYLNEANKVTFEHYREIASRAKHIYIDFNPNAKFWVHDHVINRDDCDFLKLTFQDNEYLSKEERDEIMRYYSLGYDSAGNEINKYWANKWRVYGLGEVGIIDGAVFENWEVIETIPTEARLLGYGLDFGFRPAPCAVVAVYQWNKSYILDNIIYESGLTNQDLADMLLELNAGRELIYADSAEPKSIEEVSRSGINIHPCDSKTDIRDYAIQKLQRERFYITRRSDEMINEFTGAVWDVDKDGRHTGKIRKANDHSIDATIYFIGTIDKYDGKY